jgi:hypothetical protein
VPFSFHEGFPVESTLNVDLGIFHNPNHLKLQSPSGWHSFYIQQNARVEGVVHFYLEKGEAASPYRSPFGSYIFSDTVTEVVLTEFIAYCEDQLISKKAKSIVLKNQPEVYSTQKNLALLNALNKLGYSIIKEETSAVIPVTGKAFESGLHKSEKKKLRKCRESALTFEIMLIEQLQKIYIFLEACREEKGYSLSMSFEEMKQLAKAFPERIILTAVIDKNKIVAANISIRVYDHVLYNFYHDHASEYDPLSPVVLLNEGLYQLCQKSNFQFLDLGTSNIEGELNESLLNFKLNLGAKTSRKLTFTKNLA